MIINKSDLNLILIRYHSYDHLNMIWVILIWYWGVWEGKLGLQQAARWRSLKTPQRSQSHGPQALPPPCRELRRGAEAWRADENVSEQKSWSTYIYEYKKYNNKLVPEQAGSLKSYRRILWIRVFVFPFLVCLSPPRIARVLAFRARRSEPKDAAIALRAPASRSPDPRKQTLRDLHCAPSPCTGTPTARTGGTHPTRTGTATTSPCAPAPGSRPDAHPRRVTYLFQLRISYSELPLATAYSSATLKVSYP